MYEFEDGREVTEVRRNLAYRDVGRYDAPRREIDRLIRTVHHSGLEASTVQVVTGLFVRFRRGERHFKSGEPRYTNRIHRDDAVGLLHAMTVAEAEHLPPIVLEVDDPSVLHGMTLLPLANALGAELSEGGVGRAPLALVERPISDVAHFIELHLATLYATQPIGKALWRGSRARCGGWSTTRNRGGIGE